MHTGTTSKYEYPKSSSIHQVVTQLPVWIVIVTTVSSNYNAKAHWN